MTQILEQTPPSGKTATKTQVADVIDKIERVREHRKNKFYLRDEHVTLSHGSGGKASHNLIEGVRQLMGEGGKRQVKDTTNALVTGIGWINYGRNWGTSAALALVPNQ